ncbi:MAG TPA: PadR family transcriptional regulator [Cellulomonas sp.]
MLVEIVLLSNLRAGPVHGYELKRRVQRPLAATLSNNSLYPILRRLEQEGAVTHEIQEVEGRPPRKVYALTPVGRERLRQDVAVLPDALADDEEEFLLRVGFFAELTAAERLGVVMARDAALERRAEQLAALLREMADPGPHPWRALAARHVLTQIATERAWLTDLAHAAAAQPDLLETTR